MRILSLRERFSWMGQHSGYDLLNRFLPDDIQCSSVCRQRGRRLPLVSGCLMRKAYGLPLYDHSSLRAEIQVLWRGRLSRHDLVHVNYLEEHYGLLRNAEKWIGTPVVATAHQPPSWWRLYVESPDSLTRLRGLIIVAESQREALRHLVSCPIRFIPHGVDVDFFSPSKKPGSATGKHILFGGCHLRDLEALEEIVRQLSRRSKQIEFDFIVPRKERGRDAFARLARYSTVRWHGGLTDESLLRLYRHATAVCLPLLDATANNMLLEGMACGLPVVSNDVGGVPSYMDNKCGFLLPEGDVDGMVAAVERLCDDGELRDRLGKGTRDHCVENLSWTVIAEKTAEFYKEIVS